MSYWPLIGVALVVLGFALRMNPALVVVGAGVVTGLVAGNTPVQVLELLGEAFTKQRYLAIFLLTLPVIGLLERHGLKERAQAWIATLRGATAGRLLIAYLAARQITATLGLTSLGGHPQTVRPLLAPMVEAAAEGAADAQHGTLPEAQRERLKALSAATDNVGLFFGEDIFIAFGAVLLMQGFYAEYGIALEPLHIALWGIPTAICAFAIHATRLSRLDARLAREVAALRARRHAAAGMITLQWVYWLTGLYLAAVAVLGWRDRGNPRRTTTALFWGLLGAMLLVADRRANEIAGMARSHEKHGVRSAAG